MGSIDPSDAFGRRERALGSRPMAGRLLAATVVLALVVAAAGIASAAPTGATAAGTIEPQPPAGYSWSYIHTFFDSDDGPPLVAIGCDGEYGKGDHGCGGTYASATTTPPFAGVHGTVLWHQTSGTAFDLNLFAVGAEMRGSLASPSANAYTVTSLLFPGAPGGFSGTATDIPVGEKGAPLQLGFTDHDCASTPELAHCNITLDIRGWLMVKTSGIGDPIDTTTTTTPPTTIAPPVTPAPAAVVATPRFTG
jgi:hypothetical protein